MQGVKKVELAIRKKNIRGNKKIRKLRAKKKKEEKGIYIVRKKLHVFKRKLGLRELRVRVSLKRKERNQKKSHTKRKRRNHLSHLCNFIFQKE